MVSLKEEVAWIGCCWECLSASVHTDLMSLFAGLEERNLLFRGSKILPFFLQLECTTHLRVS